MVKDGLLNRVRRNLADILQPNAAPAESPQVGKRRAASAARKVESFDEQLRKLLEQSGKSSAAVGRLYIIGLQKIADQLGPEWEHVAERAGRIARNTIERQLSEGDIFAALPGVSFVIVFAHLSVEQAQMKCVLIGNQIANALLGEKGAEMLEVRAAVSRTDGSFDLQALPTSAEELMDALSDIEEDRRLLDKAAGAAPRVPTSSSTHPRDPLEGLRFAYRPTWDLTRNVISTHRCVPFVPAPGAGLVDADAVIGTDEGLMERVDHALLARVMADLDQVLRDGRQLLLSFPVHFQTFASMARRRNYLNALAQHVGSSTAKPLVIALSGVPDGVPESRLAELTAPLRSHCRAVVLRMAIGTTDFTNVKASGVTVVGCNIAFHPGPELILMQQMNRFSRAAAKASLLTYLQGARALSQVTAALAAGFTYVDGDAVAKAVDHPYSVAQFGLADLYRPFIRAEELRIIPHHRR